MPALYSMDDRMAGVPVGPFPSSGDLTMLPSFTRLIIAHRVLVLLATLVVTGLTLFFSANLRFIIDPAAILPHAHPFVASKAMLEEVFGEKYAVMVAVARRDGGAADVALLEKVPRITDGLKALAGGQCQGHHRGRGRLRGDAVPLSPGGTGKTPEARCRQPAAVVADNKRDSFVGSDLTFDDIIGHKPADWTHALMRADTFEGRAVWVIESLPKDDAIRERTGYSRRVSWIDRKTFVPLKLEFWDEAGAPLKTSTAGTVVAVEGARGKW